jgi:hypothetical protein
VNPRWVAAEKLRATATSKAVEVEHVASQVSAARSASRNLGHPKFTAGYSLSEIAMRAAATSKAVEVKHVASQVSAAKSAARNLGHPKFTAGYSLSEIAIRVTATSKAVEVEHVASQVSAAKSASRNLGHPKFLCDPLGTQPPSPQIRPLRRMWYTLRSLRRGKMGRGIFVVKSGNFRKVNQVVERTANRVCVPGEGMRGVKLIS